MKTKEEVLKSCVIVGNIVKLPNEKLDRDLYLEVAKSLNLIGGKWKGGKVAGFVFQEDPTELLAEISSGTKRNLKKEHQFFGTPAPIADYLVELAQIKGTDSVLEPSAGQGAIIEAILRVRNDNSIFYCENMPTNAIILDRKFKDKRDINSLSPLNADFLELESLSAFDKVIANPPFSKNQDIDHIKKMYQVCAYGGRIVTIASKHWKHSVNSKETEFRNWLTEVGRIN